MSCTTQYPNKEFVISCYMLLSQLVRQFWMIITDRQDVWKQSNAYHSKHFSNVLCKSLTLPTYCVSAPVYSSSRKNWFHIQPRLTRCSILPSFLVGLVTLLLVKWLLDFSCDAMVSKVWNMQIQINGDRQWNVLIICDFKRMPNPM